MKDKLVLQYSCGQDMNAMPQTVNGVWCVQCKHEVYDFTGYSVADVRRISREKNISCGIFTEQHFLPEKTYNGTSFHHKLRYGLATLVTIALLETSSLQGQNPVKPVFTPRHELNVKQFNDIPADTLPEKEMTIAHDKKAKATRKRKQKHPKFHGRVVGMIF